MRTPSFRPSCFLPSLIALALCLPGVALAQTIPSSAPLVMPLGDSITLGATDTNNAGGYREQLYLDCKNAGIPIQLIGSTNTNSSTLTINAGQQLHNGYGSYTILDLRSNLDGNVPPPYGSYNQGGNWLTGGSTTGLTTTATLPISPQIVLLMAGTNDIYQGATLATAESRMTDLLTWFQTNRPTTQVYVAQIVPLASPYVTQAVQAAQQLEGQQYNQWLGMTVPTKFGPNFHVVNMYPPFVDAKGVPKVGSASDGTGIYLTDGIHPSHNGYVAMGDLWFNAIKSQLMALSNLKPTGTGPVNMLTQHNDVGRSGANLSETTLTPSNVTPNTFGKLFSLAADGYVYAQPLYVSNLSIAGGTHNVVFVATAHDSVYAYDADNGTQYWQVSLGTSVPSSDINTINMPGEIGITSTPVIDPTTNTLYCVALTKENGNEIFRLHALDITTGAEKLGGPTVIQASVPGTGDGNVSGVVPFTPIKQNNRPGLLLLNGTIYLAFGSHEDYDPYHGWVMAYDASTLQQITVFNDTPNGGRGGIWQAGQGLAADTLGNVYAMTGNGTTSAPSGGSDYSEAFLKLGLSSNSTTGNSLAVKDWFIPNNYDWLNAYDMDLGSAGVLSIPGTNLIVGGGKEGKLYLISTANMGHYNAGSDPVVQEFQAVQSRGYSGHIHGAPIYWNGPTGPHIFLWGENDFLRSFAFNPATATAAPSFTTTASSVGTDYAPASTSVYGMPGGFLSVSANGSQNGIVWATTPTDGNAIIAVVHGILRAYDATDLTKELWDSQKVTSRDDFGLFAKFTPPTVANGKVYLATYSNQVCVYGLLSAPSTPTNLTATSGNASVVLSWPAAPYATTYNLYRGTFAGGEAATPITSGINALTYTDTGLTNGTKYFYTLTAVNANGQSVPSNEASTTPVLTIGTLLGLRFVGGSYYGTSASMAATESAGVVPVTNWNNAFNGSGTFSSLLDNLGETTAASATWATDSVWSLPITDTAGNNRMMRGFIDAYTKPGTVTLTNLPTSITTNGYDVYVYADSDNASYSFTGGYTIGSTTQSLTDAPNANFSGTFTQAVSNGSGNYLKFSNVTGSGFTLTLTPGTTNSSISTQAMVNAIEIAAHPTAVPTNLTATAGNTQIALSWTASTAAAAYNLYRGTTAGAEATTPIATGLTSTAYTDTSLTNRTKYFYKVTAVNASGQSAQSNEASATPTPPVSAAPTNLTATAGNAQVALSWTASTGAATYSLYRGTAAGGEAATPVATGITGTTYTNTGLTNGTKYFYKVTAVNASGQSASSNEASVAPVTVGGKILSLRFVGGSYYGTSASMAATESAGVVATTNWNNALNASGTLSSLRDSLGGITAASATWATDGAWSLPITDTAGNNRMMRGFIDAYTKPGTVTLTSLPASVTANGYDVYVYVDSDNAGYSFTNSYTIGSTTQTLTDAPNTNFNGTFTQAVSGGKGNYLKFSNVTGSSFTLTLTPGSTTSSIAKQAMVNAIEIAGH